MKFDTSISPFVKMRSYVNKDMVEAIESMSKSEMNTLLVELSNSAAWVAVLKYMIERMNFAQSTLFTLDPVKDMTSMSRIQGVATGLLDLPDAVYSLTARSEKEVKNSQE